MRPEVWSRSRITIIDVVDLPQPDSPTRPTLSPWPTVKLMPSTARNMFGLDRRLAGEQFAEHGGGALARIFLDEFFDEEQRLCILVTPGLDPGVHRLESLRRATRGRVKPGRRGASSSGNRSRNDTPIRGVARISFLV